MRLLLGSVGTQGLSLGDWAPLGSLRWAGAGPGHGGCGTLLVGEGLRGGSEPGGAGDLLWRVAARNACCQQLAALFSRSIKLRSPSSRRRDPLPGAPPEPSPCSLHWN